jgi:hypothetical protein
MPTARQLKNNFNLLNILENGKLPKYDIYIKKDTRKLIIKYNKSISKLIDRNQNNNNLNNSINVFKNDINDIKQILLKANGNININYINKETRIYITNTFYQGLRILDRLREVRQ